MNASKTKEDVHTSIVLFTVFKVNPRHHMSGGENSPEEQDMLDMLAVSADAPAVQEPVSRTLRGEHRRGRTEFHHTEHADPERLEPHAAGQGILPEQIDSNPAKDHSIST